MREEKIRKRAARIKFSSDSITSRGFHSDVHIAGILIQLKRKIICDLNLVWEAIRFFRNYKFCFLDILDSNFLSAVESQHQLSLKEKFKFKFSSAQVFSLREIFLFCISEVHSRKVLVAKKINPKCKPSTESSQRHNKQKQNTGVSAKIKLTNQMKNKVDVVQSSLRTANVTATSNGVVFKKKLTSSDCNGPARLVVNKVQLSRKYTQVMTFLCAHLKGLYTSI